MVSPSAQTERAERRAATEELLGELALATGPRRRVFENELITLNVPVAREVAARYHGRGISTDDLEQVACVGLVKAVRGYDPDKATDFLSFAVPTIRGEIRRHFRDAGWVVRPPRSVQEMQARISRARGELWQLLGREPVSSELAEHLDVDTEPVLEALSANGCFVPASLDAGPENDDAAPVERLGGSDPGYTQAEARVALRPLLRELSDRERRILELRFGQGRTQAEIGREIGVTQMQVSRLLANLFDRLRAELVQEAA
ncbi:SigB/SigF/SigG family RNA polymerase sigma factor [Nocardioides coralli]|uniref:SigB/SigF/SigG family RNA polymerase sigma factor n=1 Tax=Nocardioides coralli TaxID=2872154 RepID=UPI0020178803|nr:SigB/SigF/SigG family RNA polymerase sigma factor [Nocardioides coralli]